MCGAVQLEITGDPAVQAFCHCSSCRGWLSAPIHAAALWPATSVKVTKGADNLGLYKKTENSHRQFCRSCGAAVLVGHPGMGMVDVPAGSVVVMTRLSSELLYCVFSVGAYSCPPTMSRFMVTVGCSTFVTRPCGS
jgi:hypothetical protein